MVAWTPARHRRASLLVEVVVALGLAMIFGVALAKMGLGSFGAISSTRSRLAAVHLATEGMEAVRVIGRQDFDLLQPGSHGLTIDAEQRYGLSGTSATIGKYTRVIDIEPVYRDADGTPFINPAEPSAILAANGWLDPQQRSVHATVTWNEGARTQTVRVSSLIGKWYRYPLQALSSGTGGLSYGTERVASGTRLMRQPTFSPPTILGSVLVPDNDTVIALLMDTTNTRLIVVTQNGIVASYNVEGAGQGQLTLQDQLDLEEVLHDAALVGENLYVASENDAGEVFIVTIDPLSLAGTIDLAGTQDAWSIAPSVDASRIYVGRQKGASAELAWIHPDPTYPSPVLGQRETGSGITTIEAYSEEWILFATDKTSAELAFFNASTSALSTCNMQGAQLITNFDRQEDQLLIGRRKGPDGIAAIFQLDSLNPTLCSDYATPVWSNEITNVDVNQAILDPFDPLAYVLANSTSDHFQHSDTDADMTTQHTLIDGATCTRIVGDGSYLYVACDDGAESLLLVLGGGGTSRTDYVMSGAYLFPAIDGGSDPVWRALYWTGAGTNVRLYTRTAADVSTLTGAVWLGPPDVLYGYPGFTVSGAPIQVLSGTGNRYLQLKAEFWGDETTTSIIDTVTVLYE